MAVGRCFRVYQKYVQGSPFSLIVENTRNSEDFLLFESGVVASLQNEGCEEFKRAYTRLVDAYGIMGIVQLFGQNNVHNDYLLLVTAVVSVGKINECDIYRVNGVQFVPMWRALPDGVIDPGDDRITEMQKLMSNGMFYFAFAADQSQLIDLSLCSQKRHQGSISDYRFFWNRTLHLPLQRFGVDTSKWLLRCMCGSVFMRTVYVGHRTAKACVISRLSCERMGTRFNVRGVNDYGHVANFVETEQVIFFEDQETSFVQTRGSIPLFWEQPGVQVGSHKVKLSRGFEASAPAYDRHFKLLKSYYGDQVIVNLLGSKEGEKMLSQAFKTHHDNSPHAKDVVSVTFDYHSMVRMGNKVQNMAILWRQLESCMHKFGYFHAEKDRVTRKQTGAVRTNCLDCLDRTNCVQTFLGLQALPWQLAQLRMESSQANVQTRFEEVFRDLWQKNGDQCSVIYAGTGALEGKSKFKDASRSVARTIQNNLMDGSKQEAMDLLLLGSALTSELYDRAASFLPVNLMQACPNALTNLVERVDEFTTMEPLRLFVGTWNVNGGKNMHNVAFRKEAHLADWLFDLPLKAQQMLLDLTSDLGKNPDIVAIGLEEIIDLNATNIMKASTTNQRLWSEGLRKVLGERQKYIMITSLQLVGVCIFIFIRPKLAPYIRDLSTDVVKTGMGGATGNKGSVTVRFVLHSTSICFVCSHFAAGQKEVHERNNDYAETVKRIQFPMGRNIFSHDLVFWFGDFNYRIDLHGEEVKSLVRSGDFASLVNSDQLTCHKALGNTFVGFCEGPLNFAPTYKYDTFSDDYDTSEKCRAPAWTDRVLWFERAPLTPQKQPSARLRYYGRAELKTSDHRPVGAVFDISVRRVDKEKREMVYKEIISCMGPPDCTVLVSFDGYNPFPMDCVDGVLQKVAELHMAVLLVKFVGADMWLIFDDGEMALAALSMDGVRVNGLPVSVRLRSPNWDEDEQLAMRDATADDCDYSLLADSTNTEEQFHSGEEDDDEPPVVIQMVKQVGSSAAAPPKRPPPPRSSAPTSIPNVNSTGSMRDLAVLEMDLPNAASNLTLVPGGDSRSSPSSFVQVNLLPNNAPPDPSHGAVPRIPARPNTMRLGPPNEAPPWDMGHVASPGSCMFESDFVPPVPPRPAEHALPQIPSRPYPPPR